MKDDITDEDIEKKLKLERHWFQANCEDAIESVHEVFKNVDIERIRRIAQKVFETGAEGQN